jgi:hypothetical protein
LTAMTAQQLLGLAAAAEFASVAVSGTYVPQLCRLRSNG